MPLSREDLQLWKRRLATDRSAQAQYHERWRRAIRLFDTTYWDELKAANPELVEVNYSTTFITTLVSAVFARAPKWHIEAKRPGRFYRFAETMAVLMEQFKEEAKLKDLAIRAVVDAATCNIGWIEQGFYGSTKQPLPGPETGQDEQGMMRRMGALLGQLTGKQPLEPAQQGELHQQKRPGSFYLFRRSPWDVIVPEGFYEYERLPYLIVRDRLTWGDFLARPDLINQERMGTIAIRQSMRKLDVIRTSPYTSEAVYNPKAASGSLATRDPDRPVEIFTVWDRREDQVFTFSETSDAVHKEPEDWPYFAEGFPQQPLQFNYVPEIPDERDNFYGFSDIDPIFAQVMEKSELRTQQSSIRRRAIVKVFVQQGSATESQMAKVQSPDIEVIPVQNIQAIQVSQGVGIPPAVLQMEDIIDKDLSRDSGLALLLADSSQLAGVQRATVANIAQQTSTLKSSYRVDRIESWVKAIGRYQLGLFWQYLSVEEVGERLGRMPEAEEWIVLPEDLRLAKQWVRDELKLAVETGSTKPLTTDVLERDQYMNSLAILQQVDPLLFQQIKRPAIAILAKKFNEPALEQLILAALDPQEQEAAQMENQLMAQGMPQVVGPHDDHQTHIAIHSQMAQHPIVAAHIQAHQVRLQELAGNQKTAGQGVRQKAAAPSAAEIGQGGATRGMDMQGAAMNLGPGSSGQAAFRESGA